MQVKQIEHVLGFILEEAQHRGVQALATLGADSAKPTREFGIHVADSNLGRIHDFMALPA